MLDLTFSQKEIEEIQEILQRHGEKPMDVHKGIREIWFSNDSEAELRILFLGKLKLTISRVCFENKRQGTMSEIFAFLKEFCKNNQIQILNIQSVETAEMAAWCKKNGIKPDPIASMELPELGYTVGDYNLYF